MMWRRYWAVLLLLVAALNIVIGVWAWLTVMNPGAIANFVIAVFIGWIGIGNLKASRPHPRITGPLWLPQINQLPFVLIPAWPTTWEDALVRFRPATPAERGLKLLLSYLDEDQREEFLATEAFTFQAPSGRWLRILPTTYYSVHEVRNPELWLPTFEEGMAKGGEHRQFALTQVVDRAIKNVKSTSCAYPRSKDRLHPLPMEDVMLAVYLRILADERGFIHIANQASGNTLADYFFRIHGHRGTCLRPLNKLVRTQGWPVVFRALEEQQHRRSRAGASGAAITWHFR